MLRAVGSESLSMTRMRTFTLASSDCLATLSIVDETLGLRKVQIQTVSSIALECVDIDISCDQNMGCLLSFLRAQTERGGTAPYSRVARRYAYPIDCQAGREVGGVTADLLYGGCVFDSHVTTWTLLDRADEGW